MQQDGARAIVQAMAPASAKRLLMVSAGMLFKDSGILGVHPTIHTIDLLGEWTAACQVFERDR